MIRPFGKPPVKSVKTRKASRVLVCGFISLLLSVILLFFISPVPAALLIRLAFEGGMATPPANYAEMRSLVSVVKDLSYPSSYQNNQADIYMSANTPKPAPVVLWLHGGAFVGGDKSDVEIFATSLAAEGFAVVCINYQLAPEAKYPTPLLQTAEAYHWLTAIADDYSLNLNQFFLAGDSAGAHIVAQFAAIQSSQAYATEMAMAQIIPPHTLKGILLFCGPYDVAEIKNTGNALLNFFLDNTAWAYFDTKDWSNQFAAQATIANHITSQFPPAFITDGNTGSFEAHARKLETALLLQDVSVESYFIPLEAEAAMHEYQFKMNTPAGWEAFAKALRFLQTHLQ